MNKHRGRAVETRHRIKEIQADIARLVSEQERLEEEVLELCPCKDGDQSEWYDFNDVIWHQCRICGRTKIVGQIHQYEDRTKVYKDGRIVKI